MFETAAISSVPAGARLWSTCVSAAGEAFVLAAVTAISIWSPAALPKPQAVLAWLSAQAPPRQAAVPAQPVTAPKMRPLQFKGSKLYEPTRIPSSVVTIEDPPIPPGTILAGPLEISRAIGDTPIRYLPLPPRRWNREPRNPPKPP